MKDLDQATAGYHVVPSLNRAQVYRAIMATPPLSVTDLVARTGLNKLTVVKYVRDLEADGLIREIGHNRPVTGRPARLYVPNPQGKVSVAIHLDVPLLRVAIVDLEGQVNAQHVVYLPVDDANASLDLIVHQVSQMLEREQVNPNRLLGIGVAIPGILHVASGVSVDIPRIRGWSDVPLERHLEERFRVPVRLVKDTNAMALAEQEFGAASNERNFGYVYAGDGIGIGMVLDGRLHEPSYSPAGLGHTTVDLNGPRCRCGSTGCLELFASANAVLRADGHDVTTLSSQARLDAFSDLLTRYAGNEEIPAVQSAVRACGAALANVLNLFELDALIIGGPILAGGDRVLDELRTTINERSYIRAGSPVRLVAAGIDHAGLIGSVVIYRRSLITPVSVESTRVARAAGRSS